MTDESVDEKLRIYFASQSQPTLRDQFAMAALTGLLANSRDRYAFVDAASDAYRVADSMLEARREKK